MQTDDLPVVAPTYSIFADRSAFETAQRVAIMLSKSTLVPEAFRGKAENCMIALELADRVKMSSLMVMQHMAVVNGKPGWDAQFIIAKINSCGRYEPLKFEQEGEGDNRVWYAWTRAIGSEEKLIGPKVTWLMVRDEGWLGKTGSKWKTMPEVMGGYRAASFWGKRYCPELLLGMPSADELEDVGPRVKNMGNAEVVIDTDGNSDVDLNELLGGEAGASATSTDASSPGEGHSDTTKPAAQTSGKGPEQALAFTVAKIIRAIDMAKTLAELDAIGTQALQCLPAKELAETRETLKLKREAITQGPGGATRAGDRNELFS
jgi:hypothetical protein